MFFGLIGLKFGRLGCTPSRIKNPKGIFLVVSYKRLLRFRKWTKSVSKDYMNIRQYIPIPSFLSERLTFKRREVSVRSNSNASFCW